MHRGCRMRGQWEWAGHAVFTFEMVELCDGYLGRVIYYRCDVVVIHLADVGHTRRAEVFLYAAVFPILYIRDIDIFNLMKETAVLWQFLSVIT